MDELIKTVRENNSVGKLKHEYRNRDGGKMDHKIADQMKMATRASSVLEQKNISAQILQSAEVNDISKIGETAPRSMIKKVTENGNAKAKQELDWKESFNTIKYSRMSNKASKSKLVDENGEDYATVAHLTQDRVGSRNTAKPANKNNMRGDQKVRENETFSRIGGRMGSKYLREKMDGEDLVVGVNDVAVLAN